MDGHHGCMDENARIVPDTCKMHLKSEEPVQKTKQN
jgi:hypothetical protein